MASFSDVMELAARRSCGGHTARARRSYGARAVTKRFRLGVHTLRNGLQIPDQSRPRQHLERVPSRIKLPPIEALASGAHEAMVVVMPAFAERDDGKKKIVTAVVTQKNSESDLNSTAEMRLVNGK